jgi:hypothetical protein
VKVALAKAGWNKSGERGIYAKHERIKYKNDLHISHSNGFYEFNLTRSN